MLIETDKIKKLFAVGEYPAQYEFETYDCCRRTRPNQSRKKHFIPFAVYYALNAEVAERPAMFTIKEINKNYADAK